VDAHAVERRDFLAEQRAVFVAVAPALAVGLLLRLVVAAHAVGSGLQRVALCLGQSVEGGLEVALREFEFGHALRSEAIETRGVFEHGCVAALFHVADDFGHSLLEGGVGRGSPVQALGEPGFEIGLRGRKPQRLGLKGHAVTEAAGATAFSNASMMRRMGSRLSLSAAWLTTRRAEMSMMCS